MQIHLNTKNLNLHVLVKLVFYRKRPLIVPSAMASRSFDSHQARGYHLYEPFYNNSLPQYQPSQVLHCISSTLTMPYAPQTIPEIKQLIKEIVFGAQLLLAHTNTSLCHQSFKMANGGIWRMEVLKEISELPDHYTTPIVNTPDRQRDMQSRLQQRHI